MPNQTIYVTVDRAAFLAAVQKYLDLSPVTTEWNVVNKYKWPDAVKPPQLWNTIAELQHLISVVVSAVELAKQNIIKEQDPDGSKGAKFDKEIALGTAVQILLTLVKFNGWLGAIVNTIWGSLLNLLVSFYVNGLPSGDWVQIALTVLKLASV